MVLAQGLKFSRLKLRLMLLAAAVVATLAIATTTAPTPAEASCGNWYMASPNRIVSFDYGCTYYFDANGWYIAAIGCPPSGACYWLLGRDGT